MVSVERRFRNNFSRRGFTLLELLLALALTAALVAILFEALHTTTLARNTTEQAVAPSRTAQIVFQMLRSDLQMMPPIAQTSTSNNGGVLDASSVMNPTQPGPFATYFEGQQSSDDRGHRGDIVDFFALSDGQLVPQNGSGNGIAAGSQLGGTVGGYGNTGTWYPSSETKLIELAIDVPNGSSDHCLVRKIWHNLPSLNPNQNAVTTTNSGISSQPDQEEVICRGVDSFSVQYYDGTNWLDTWDSTQEDNQAPAAVSITVGIEPRPSDPPGTQIRSYTHVIALPCSNVINDTNLSGLTGGTTGGF